MININGELLQYPDLERAYQKGLDKVQRGEATLDIKIDKTKDKPRNNQVLHVSDLGYAYGLCPRQLWLKLHNADKREKHYGEKLMLQHGEIIHLEAVELIRLGLDNYWEISAVEKPVEGIGLVGRTDMILQGAEGEKVIVDFKSSRGRNFDYLDRDGLKPEPKAQVKGYIQITNADYGILFYIDREGQNGVRQFPVMPEDMTEQVQILEAIMMNEPTKLEPQVKIRENKGDNSIYLNMPWQCNYCDYLDISCNGALEPQARDISGIVAKQSDNEIYAYKDKYKGLLPIIKEVC